MPLRGLLAVMVLALSMAAAKGEPVQSWPQLIDQAKGNDALAPARAEFLAHAREIAALPIVRRAHTLAEVGTRRTWLDGRSAYLEPEIKEQFALAMSDFGACGTLARELPMLAAAYRLTGEEAFRQRLLRQLREVATWSPLQRPGWTLYAPGNRLPEGGQDGNWLATGLGVRAIAETLEIMPAGSVERPLRLRLERLLEGEIAGVVDDWQAKRPWFVAGDNPITNQWMLPTEGLVTACLVLGVDRHRSAYELGVRNFLRALQAHGSAGEFEEGIGYATFTVTSMLYTARAMAAAGDRRAIEQPFLRHFPTWAVEHLQPGGMLINCFDAGSARDTGQLRPLLSIFALCSGSPVARWGLDRIRASRTDDLPALLVAGMPAGRATEPPLFAAYDHAARVNWRDSWADDATGVWVRGGHPLDQHDHHDRGHVNFIHRGRPVLIEAGTPSYDNPRMDSHYSSGVGHNVLQVGDQLPQTRPAPITVRRLDSKGGDVSVDATACYGGLRQWVRDVRWSSDELTVHDTVTLADGQADTIRFRWHLGTAEQVKIEGSGRQATVTWDGTTITLQASAPMEVTQELLPDNTMGIRATPDAEPLHTCVVVRSRDRLARFELTARLGSG